MSSSNNESMDISLEIFEMEDIEGVEAMTQSNDDVDEVEVTVNVEDKEVYEVLAGKKKVEGKGTIDDRRKILHWFSQ
jgi:hypothetical protein